MGNVQFDLWQIDQWWLPYEGPVRQDGCAVEVQQRDGIRPWSLTVGVCIKPAMFVNGVRE